MSKAMVRAEGFRDVTNVRGQSQYAAHPRRTGPVRTSDQDSSTFNQEPAASLIAPPFSNSSWALCNPPSKWKFKKLRGLESVSAGRLTKSDIRSDGKV